MFFVSCMLAFRFIFINLREYILNLTFALYFNLTRHFCDL